MVAEQVGTLHPETAAAVSSVPAPPRRVAVLILVLGALTGVGPLTIDMYVPGFPDMGRSLNASDSAVQLTMTAVLAGLVVGQLLIGPLSDVLGRRRPLLAGVMLFTLLSLVCAVAPNITVLTGARFLQGAAAAVGVVLARAIITDYFHGPRLPRYVSLLATVLGVAPVAAPVLGGAILSVATWRAVFVALALIGALLACSVLVMIPESLPPERRVHHGVSDTFRTMGRLFGHRAFMGYVLVIGFISAALFAYISGSSFVLHNLYGVSTAQYSLIFAVNAAGMLIAGASFGPLAHRIRLNTLLVGYVTLAFAGTFAQVVLLVIGGGGLAGVWACLFLTTFGMGGAFPAGMSLAQILGKQSPGAASALLGAAQFLLGALASPLVGLFGTSSALPMAVIMLIALLCGVVALTCLARPWHGAGETHIGIA